MKDEKQLVLFFAPGTVIDGANLAVKLVNKFNILGQPAVIPFDPSNPQQPLIIFNQGPINLTINNHDVSFIYGGEDHAKLYDEIMDIAEFFEDLDYSFERMGYVTTIIHSKKERENFKSNVFKDPEVASSEFQFSWYSKELVDSVRVNVWEREMTDIMNGVELVSVFDINTPIDEVYNITSDFLRDFIKQCDKYVEKKDKKYK